MKGKTATIVLAAVSVLLVIALVVRSRQASEEKKADVAQIVTLSNQWQTTSADLEEHKQVITNLETDLNTRRSEIASLSNNLVEVTTNLTATQIALKNSQEEIAKRDVRIAELEAQNSALERQAGDLEVAITNLNTRIEDIKNKLIASEGDKAFLEKELKRLMTEKAELERKFNDIAVLRAQVKKLKTELTVAKRLEWMRFGVNTTEKKGAQKQMEGLKPASQPKHYDLNVEVKSDGSLKTIAPRTNAPAAYRKK